MNTVNVSRGTGWIRVILAVACFGAVGWGVYLLWKYHDTVYRNLGGLYHFGFYSILALYLVTFLAAVVGVISGASAVRSPGKAPGWILNLALVVLVALTFWACLTTVQVQFYLVS